MSYQGDIDICICTYRRAHVAETLRSLARLDLKPSWKIRVIIADNDETPGARELVETTARANSLVLVYIHAPARNISVARNACLDAATAPLVAFIDDDEIATPQWLSALVTTLENSNADVVLGPVQSFYGSECPLWMQKGDFHSKKPVWIKNKIVTGYTGNVLLRHEAPALQGLRFRKELGRSGGEDTIFFSAVHRAGGKIVYAPDAIVTEAVPAGRAQALWLMKRNFRSGQTHGLVLLESSHVKPLTRIKNIVLGLAKIGFCLAAALLNLAKFERMWYWLLRGTMHTGIVVRLLGKLEIEQYG